PGPDGWAAHLEAGFVALDESRSETFRFARSFAITLPAGSRDPSGFGLDLAIRAHLPSRAQTITAVVSDLGGSTIGATRTQLPAASTGDIPILGLSISSLGETSLWIDAAEEAPASGGSPTGPVPVQGPARDSRIAPREA